MNRTKERDTGLEISPEQFEREVEELEEKTDIKCLKL